MARELEKIDADQYTWRGGARNCRLIAATDEDGARHYFADTAPPPVMWFVISHARGEYPEFLAMFSTEEKARDYLSDNRPGGRDGWAVEPQPYDNA